MKEKIKTYRVKEIPGGGQRAVMITADGYEGSMMEPLWYYCYTHKDEIERINRAEGYTVRWIEEITE